MLDTVGRLDLVEAAKRDLARSRDHVASVAGELDEHNRWFNTYAAAERKRSRKHARWMRQRQAAMRRREWWHRTARSARRAFVTGAQHARFAGRTVLGAVDSTTIMLRNGIGVGAALLAASLVLVETKLRPAARGCARAMTAGAAVTREKARGAASLLSASLAQGLARSKETAETLASVGGAALSAGMAGLSTRSSAGFAATRAAAFAGAGKIRVLAPVLRDHATGIVALMQGTGLRLEHAVGDGIGAVKPLFYGHAWRGSSLAARLRDGARVGREWLSELVLRPLEGIVASAPGSLHAWDRRPEPAETPLMPANAAAEVRAEIRTTIGSSPQSLDGSHAPDLTVRSRALACIEPRRARLPAVLPQRGRGVLVLG